MQGTIASICRTLEPQRLLHAWGYWLVAHPLKGLPFPVQACFIG